MSASAFQQASASDWKRLEASAQTRTPDPLTVAYLVKGAEPVLASLDRIPDPIEGEMDFISRVIDHAAMVDVMADERADEMSGVFCYEVAEPLGLFIAERLARGDVNLTQAVRAQAAVLMDECCGQSADPELMRREATRGR